MGFFVGIDIEEVSRFRAKQFSQHETFYGKIFTQGEITYCLKKKDPSIHFTGIFAAKEAVFKAVNTLCMISLAQIEIIHGKHGGPLVQLGKVTCIKNGDIQISISHTKEYAAAVALAQMVQNG